MNEITPKNVQRVGVRRSDDRPIINPIDVIGYLLDMYGDKEGVITILTHNSPPPFSEVTITVLPNGVIKVSGTRPLFSTTHSQENGTEK